MTRTYFILIIFIFPCLGSARVFDFQKQVVATYIRGSYGLNKLQKQAYKPGFPASVDFPDHGGVNQAYSADFGFSLTTKNAFNIKLGVELLYPQLSKEVSGVNASGTQLLSVTSEVYSVIPQLNLEVFLEKTPKWRWFAGGGVGYAVATIKNTVSMTASGTSSLGVSDYIEEGTGWGLMSQLFTGIEFPFFDNVALSLEAGYRILTVSQYSSNRDSTTALGGVAKGNTLRNVDGTDRSTDLGGPWASATLRLYIF